MGNDQIKTVKRKRVNSGKHVDIQIRQRTLGRIILKLEKKDSHITRRVLLSEMKKNGYAMDSGTLYRDKKALNQTNTFLRDLTESNFSAYLEDIYNKLNYIEEQARIQYEKTWTASKKVKKTTGEGMTTETHITEELAAPKASFLIIMAKISEQKARLLTGDPMQLSVALLGQKFQELKNQSMELAQVDNEKHT